MYVPEQATARSLRAVTILLGALYCLAVGSVGVNACSTPDSGAAAPGENADADEDAGVEASSEGFAGDATDDAAAESQAFVRIAQLSPDTPPLDVCVAPHGTSSFLGPLFAQLAGQDGGEDGGPPGLAFGQVTAYLTLSPGTYDVRLVAAGALDCTFALALPVPVQTSMGADDGAESAPDDAATEDDAVDDFDADEAQETDTDATQASMDAAAPDARGGPIARVADTTNLASLAFGTRWTLMIAGDLTPAGEDRGLTVSVMADDAELAGGAVLLRAVNAVPAAPSLDFGLGSFETSWLPLLIDVAFGMASAQAGPNDGVVDPDGYLALSALSNGVVSARPSTGATADTTVASDVTIAVGSIATIAAIGGKTGDVAHPPALLLCVDNQPPGALLSDCRVAQ